MTPAVVLGVLATAAYVVRLVPQPLRLWRTGVADGVSPLAAWNLALTDAAWFAYGLWSGVVAVTATAGVSVPLALWTALALWPQTRRHDLAVAGVWAGVIVAAAVFDVLGAVLAVSVFVCHGPQVWKALREDALDGIAPATYVFALADGGLWGAFGVVIGDLALVGYGAVLVAVAVVVLSRLVWVRRVAARTCALRPAPPEGLAGPGRAAPGWRV